MSDADQDELGIGYASRLAAYRELCAEVEYALKRSLEGERIRAHLFATRVKELDSLRDKAVRKGWTKPLDQASDVVGARVVVLFKSDVPKAIAAIKSTFEILKEEDKSLEEDASSFGYSGTHLDCRLGQGHSGARYDTIKDYLFEVQVRTIVEDAWAAVSHVLGYKGQTSIPRELQRDFYALSGMFYVADQHFELFYNQAEQAGRKAVEAIDARTAEPRRKAKPLPLNADTLVAYLNITYPDREPATRAEAAELIPELEHAGITTIPKTAAMLRRARKAFNEYERARPPKSGRYFAIGVARTSLYLASAKARGRVRSKNATLLQFALPEIDQ
jgi:putative GTP pyrophosphokinase